jgi:endonuclease/exonuclease/phosphatase family metal-dependent hydrolase
MPVDSPAVRWIGPADEGDRKTLRSWCDAVGPLAVNDPKRTPARRDRPLIVVSWNMAVGDGDLRLLLKEVQKRHGDADLILLLQEAYRAKTPPADCPAGSRRVKALGMHRPSDTADILELASRHGLSGVYAPSMRNGQNCMAEPREDRGNAILSTLPLSDVTAIELPFAKERRVAVAAVVHDGDRRIGVVSTHFDTTSGHRRMAEAISQTMSILEWKDRVVVAGDFNSGLPLDSGIREMKEHFKELDCGGGATHKLGTRLDHIFIGTGDAPFACQTGDPSQRFGSDHSFLIAVLRDK